MRIRTQLILAAFVLAVVPLAAIVTYSYHSSRRALESAYRREADRLTKQMDRRLATIRADLDQRMRLVSAISGPEANSDVGSVVAVMGEAASLVDALEYKPLQIHPPERSEVAEAVVPEVAEAPERPETPERKEAPERAEAAAVPATPLVPPAMPIVIEIPRVPEMPRYVMSEEQRELLAEIGRLGAQLANTKLTDDERQDVREELRAAQQELREVIDADRKAYHEQMQEAQAAMRERTRAIEERRRLRAQPAPRPNANAVTVTVPTPVLTPAPASASPTKAKTKVHKPTPKDDAKSAATAKQTSLILRKKFVAPVRKQGEVVGQLTARLRPEQIIQRVLGAPTEDRSEVPFALDREGTLYTRNEGERRQLVSLGIAERAKKKQPFKGIEGWIVSTSIDPESGLQFGVARPLDNLDELRRTAARNFVLGMGLIAFALIGIVPLSNHLTRDVSVVTAGAARVAHGDLMTRLPVKSNNELGQLAKAFNRMAEDLSIHQQKLLEQERAHKEQELQQRLLAVEYERKSVELEDARRFQLSMLPKELPKHAHYDVAVFTRTATEVGGDYYDFQLAGDTLVTTIGDATGHGAKAGTMVTVIKTLFAGYAAATSPAHFLGDAAEKIKRMELGRMAMALTLAKIERTVLTVASAGMPPVLVHRAAQDLVEEIAIAATPLGTLGTEYTEQTVALAQGDTLLFSSDGFPELMNDAGQQLGYAAALDAFAAAARAENAAGVIASLEETARRWHGDAPPNDDVTFVVVRVS